MSREAIAHVDQECFRFRRTAEVDARLRDARLYLGGTLDQEWVAASKSRIQPHIALHAGHCIPDIGSFSYSHSADLDAGMTIGRYCSIAAGVAALGPEHPTSWVTTSDIAYQSSKIATGARWDVGAPTEPPCQFAGRKMPVIGNDVWIGQDARLKRGVTIGHGAVVGACALITKDVPPYAIVGGIPAKIIRFRFPQPLIERLVAVRWWNYFEPDLRGFGYNDPERFLDTLEGAISRGWIKPWRPEGPLLRDVVEGPHQST